MKSLIKKGLCTPMFIAGLFTKAKIQKQSMCPLIGDWIKMWYVYATKFHLTIKKREIFNLHTMDGPSEYYYK